MIPILSIAGCIWIIKDLRAVTIYVFLIWTRGRADLVLLLQPPPLDAGEEGVMTMLVAYAPDGRGRAVLHLAAHARALGGRRPAGVRGRPGLVAAEPGAGRRRVPGVPPAAPPRTRSSGARARLPDDVAVATRSHHARSTPAGLLELADEARGEPDRRRIVAVRRDGSVTLGSTTTRLLHSSPMPVALAPRGFRAGRARA